LALPTASFRDLRQVARRHRPRQHARRELPRRADDAADRLRLARGFDPVQHHRADAEQARLARPVRFEIHRADETLLLARIGLGQLDRLLALLVRLAGGRGRLGRGGLDRRHAAGAERRSGQDHQQRDRLAAVAEKARGTDGFGSNFGAHRAAAS